MQLKTHTAIFSFKKIFSSLVEHLSVKQNVVGSNPTIFSFVSCFLLLQLSWQSNGLLIRGSQVQTLPEAPIPSCLYLSSLLYGFGQYPKTALSLSLGLKRQYFINSNIAVYKTGIGEPFRTLKRSRHLLYALCLKGCQNRLPFLIYLNVLETKTITAKRSFYVQAARFVFYLLVYMKRWVSWLKPVPC